MKPGRGGGTVAPASSLRQTQFVTAMSAHAIQPLPEWPGSTAPPVKPARRPHHPHAHPIEVRLHDLSQLFNSMDPSPFHEKDLDHDAEEFIVSWAQEHPLNEPIALIIHLDQHPAGHDPQPLVEQSIHNYFAYHARLNRLEFNRLMKQGRTSLLIGLLFLFGCLGLSEWLLLHSAPDTWSSVLRESLTIGGWVAMWKPLEIYLYEWWPLRRRGRIFEKMSRMEVSVRVRGEG